MRPLRGNTYPIKEQLKKLGGRWDAKKKVWRLPKATYAKAAKLLEEYEERQSAYEEWQSALEGFPFEKHGW